MAEQLLNGPDVVAVFEEMRRERVAERVTRRPLDEASFEDRLSDRTLDDGFVQMMTTPLPCRAIRVESCRREEPLPAPFAARMWVLAAERPRKLHPAGTVREIFRVLAPNALQVTSQAALRGRGQHGDAILATLAVTDRDLVRIEVNVLYTQATAFEQPQACAIEQQREQPRNTVQPIEEKLSLVAGQDDGQVPPRSSAPPRLATIA